MRLQPILPIGILILMLVAAVAVTAFFTLGGPAKPVTKILSVVRLSVIYFLVFMIGLRPVTIDPNYEFTTKNLDVLFVIDSTISMWANDYNGNKPRMSGVKEDVGLIMTELAGSNFGLVTYDDSAHVLSPFTQDMTYIEDTIDLIGMPDSFYAKGSNPSVPYHDVQALLLSSDKKENRKTIVFYIGDGEVTDQNEVRSYEELAKYVDSGAVLGYGSAAGGKMKEGHSYLYDRNTYSEAVSRIDEENLKKIADDLGVQYLNMNGGNTALTGLLEIIKQDSKTIVETGTGAERYIDIYYYFAYILVALLILEAVIRTYM